MSLFLFPNAEEFELPGDKPQMTQSGVPGRT